LTLENKKQRLSPLKGIRNPARRANFALVVDMNASSKKHQAQDQRPENKHNK
jgi:hypothetical protein